MLCQNEKNCDYLKLITMRMLIFLLNAFLLNSITIYAQTPVTEYTPKGSTVNAYITPEMSTSDRSYWDAYWASSGRTYLYYFGGSYSSSNRFNCHGYAWHMVEGGQPRWIGYTTTTDEDIYMTDGSYIKVCNEIYPGKVSWVGGDHSAITTSTPGIWISKWNKWPLIQHSKFDTPFGNNFAYYASTKITGDLSPLCGGTRVLSVQNIPGATYSWTKSANITITGSTTSNSVTIQRNSYTYADCWVQVQITSPCSTTPVTTTVNLSPAINQVKVTAQSCEGSSQYYNLSALPSAGMSNWNWTVGSGTFIIYNPYSSSTDVKVTGGGALNLSYKDACGTTRTSGATVWSTCYSYSYSISPNPTANSITISTSSLEKAVDIPDIQEVIITDLRGNFKKQQKFQNAKSVTIPINNLPPGIYVAEIKTENHTERKQFIIRR